MKIIDTEKAEKDGVVNYDGDALDEDCVYFRERRLKAQMRLNIKKMWIRCRGQ